MPNLTRIAQQNERQMLQAFNNAISSVRDSVTLNEIARALDAGNVDAAVRLMQLDEAAFEPVAEAIRQSYREGGITGAQQIGTVPMIEGNIAMRFNVRNPRAERWIAQNSSRLVTEITDGTREVVRAVMVNGLAAGRNPRSTALDIVGRIDPVSRQRVGGYIGVTTQQAGWITNARTELESLSSGYFSRTLRDRRFDSTVRRAIESGTALDQATIDRAITQMQNRTQNYRGAVIARTESINALRAGQHESIDQAIEMGEVDARDVERTWSSTGDGVTRDDHLDMNGQTRPAGEPFQAPDGSLLMFPGDMSLGASAAQVIQCFVPETPIAVNNLKSAIRREYSGDVVKLRAGSSVNLSVTPNHPILTARGWVPAGEIVKGDKLIQCAASNIPSVMEPNIADGISTAEQLYNAAQSLCDSNRVSSGIVNLHGEIPAKYVDVVSVDSGLLSAFNSPVAEFTREFTLSETDVSLVGSVFGRIARACDFATPNDPGGKMGGGCSSPSFVGTIKGCATHVSFCHAGAGYTEIGKTGVDCSSAGIKFFGNPVNRPSKVEKALNLLKVWKPTLPPHFRSVLRAYGCDLSPREAFKTHVGQAGLDRVLAYTYRFGNLPNRHCSGKILNRIVVSLSRFLPVSYRPPAFVNTHLDQAVPDYAVSKPSVFADAANRLPGLVKGFEVVEVVDTDISHYEGPVYNFETDNGLVVSGNTISHNCRCSERTKIDFIGGASREVRGFS